MRNHTFKPEYDRVSVRQHKIMDSAGTSKIEMFANDGDREANQAGYTFGVITAMGSTAFTRDRFGNPCERFYEVGDNIYFKKYAGVVHRSQTDHLGRPQGDYIHTMNDIDILGHYEVEETTEE